MRRFSANEKSDLRWVMGSTFVWLLVACSFQLACAALIYLPQASPWRWLRYGVGLQGEDFLAVGATSFLLHLIAYRLRYGGALTLVALAAVSILRLAQFDALRFSGEFLSAEALRHAELAYLFFSPWTLAKYLVLPCVAVAALWSLRSRWRSAELDLGFVVAVRALAALAVIGIWAVAWASLSAEHRSNRPRLYSIDQRNPERAALQALAQVWSPALDQPDTTPATLSAADATALRGFGFSIDTEASLPLRRERAFESALARLPSAPTRPLNVIVLFFEGLSARFLERQFNGQPVTPNFDRFVADHSRATRYYNHTTPTVLGLQGQLCSFYPVNDHESWLAAVRTFRTRLRCLPHVLREHGYHTAYLNHGHRRFARLADMLAETGFDELVFGAELDQLLAPGAAAKADRSDQEMLEATLAYSRQAHGAQPFFLAVSTLDFHPPFAVNEGAGLPDAPPALRVLHQSDAAFGAFWNAFAASELAADTVLVITADHAALPGRDIVDVARQDLDFVPSVYDRVVFAVRSPAHALPERMDALASTVDLAPTLLHLLDINASQPWQGRSLYDGQPRDAGLFGSAASHSLVLDARSSPPQRWEFDMHHESYPEAVQVEAVALYRRWFAWQRSLVQQNRIW